MMSVPFPAVPAAGFGFWAWSRAAPASASTADRSASLFMVVTGK